MHNQYSRTGSIWLSISIIVSFIAIGAGDLSLRSPLNISWFLFGSLEEFKSWYPRFYLMIFLVIKSLIALVPVLMAYVIVKRFKWLKEAAWYMSGKTSTIWINVLISLGVFLGIYYVVKSVFLHSSADFFSVQLSLSRGLVIVLAFQLSVVLFGRNGSLKQLFRDFLFPLSSPHNLAILRILFFGFMTGVFWFYPSYMGAYLNMEQVPLPYMHWYSDLVNLSPETYSLICKIGAVINLFICIGFLTRPMLIINIPLIFLIIATPNFHGKLYHQHLWIWIPWILAFSKCYDVYSIDSWIRQNFSKPYDTKRKSDYSIPVRIIWLLFGIIYFFPGFQKLWMGGFDWALSESMINQIHLEWMQHYNWTPAIRIDRFPWILKIGGLAVILFELSYIFLLFKPLRWIPIFGGLLFHSLTGLLMKIWFPPVLWMYVFFLDWNCLLKQSRKKNAEPISSKTGYWETKVVIGFAAILLFANSICGLLIIHSYPFSSFPGYYSIIPSEVEVLYFEGTDADDNIIYISQELKQAGYRRENNIVFEDRIINLWQTGQNPKGEIDGYLKLILSDVPNLKSVESLKVFYQKVSLNPDKRNENT